MDLIAHYFPDLSPDQIDQFKQLAPLYEEWNAKINVISRKDIPNLYERHVLHSLAIAKFIQFAPRTHVLDVGSGGGFPGIPLAIMFPESKFDLIDSVGKKLKVVDQVSAAIGLQNVKTIHERAEEHKGSYDFITARAVSRFNNIVHWTLHLISQDQKNERKNGWLLLKGGDLDEEINQIEGRVKRYPLTKWFKEEIFLEKELLYSAKRQPHSS